MPVHRATHDVDTPVRHRARRMLRDDQADLQDRIKANAAARAAAERITDPAARAAAVRPLYAERVDLLERQAGMDAAANRMES